jgi:hypothetical protein
METLSTIKNFDLQALINRCKLVTLSPKTCWQTISQESQAPKELLRSTIVPLVIAGIVCSTVGMQLFGINMGPLGTWRPPFFHYLISQIAVGAVGVGMIFIGSFLLQKLAGMFQGSVTSERAFSLLAHSMIPMLVGNLLGIFPLLGIFGIVFAIIGLCAIYYGTPVMTSVTSSKALGFVAAFIVSMILTSIVVYGVSALLIPLPQPPLPTL